jgi:hypothetical protein
MKTKFPIKLKDGSTLPAGLPVTFIPNRASVCLVQGERVEPFKVRVSSAFKAPTVKTMEKWCNNGIAKSIGGKNVETDGWDEKGTPSWVLAAGLI